ncbi:MAG TPA: DNA polymerase ligase N-terminal domain-containing protein [Acidimicrobiia bacterium]|nr:DNA polymerase ligase N-terminal domain-containing protein [Acidimicrobiia bacterium]
MASEDRLSRYREKRDFDASPEPAGSARGDTDGERPRFVIQEHHATRLHWDLRLEHDGVLWSWAVPRGLPWSPDENNLAVHTEDHPLEYLEFSGEIPAGSYGAGTMTIWDRGTYDLEKLEPEKVVVALHGERVSGRYALFSTDGDQWMVHRMDPPSDPDRRPPPMDWTPMQATPVDALDALPEERDRYGYEIWWTGRRCLVTSSGGRVDVTVDGTPVTDLLPEVRRLGPALGSTEAIFDAVLVGVGEGGVPQHDPAGVDARLGARPDRAKRLERRHPVAALLVDLLWLDGHPLVALRYVDRRARLLDLDLASDAWQTPRHRLGDPDSFLEAVAAQGGRGIVAKGLDGTYEPGRTAADWFAIPSRAPG